jgi:hypothetical protein
LLPFFDRLASSRSVLLAGAGGGFDVYAAIPLAEALRRDGRRVHLANLSFTALAETSAEVLAEGLYEVTASTTGADAYFPERALARWLAGRGKPDVVHAFAKVGVEPLREAYRVLVDRLGLDAIVLVDGGTDILMRGDEAGLGTPVEDMTSLAAVAGLDVPQRLVACLGFGVDAFHGVCHAHALENIAELSAAGAFLGAFSLLPSMPEAIAYLEAVEHANRMTPRRPSIVNGSIADAVRGRFGDVHSTSRTAGSELFISPLMAMVFAFDLPALAARALHLPLLEGTRSAFEVALRIEGFRDSLPHRPRRSIPY